MTGKRPVLGSSGGNGSNSINSSDLALVGLMNDRVEPIGKGEESMVWPLISRRTG